MKKNDIVMIKNGSHFGEIGVITNITHDGWVQVKLEDTNLWVSKKAVKRF